MALVFDIETVGVAFDSLPPSAQEFLLRYADTPEKQDLERNSTGLSPFTGEVACVALHFVPPPGREVKPGPEGRKQGAVIVRPGSQAVPAADEIAWYAVRDERELLEKFWSFFDRGAGRPIEPPVVTFNGRSFDVPFLAVRSGILGVRVTRDLLGNRYNPAVHVDLNDQLRFQRAASWRVNLDLACRMFGIESPKSEAAHGHAVQGMWAEGRGVDIARYCYGDVRATAELYLRWRDFMQP